MLLITWLRVIQKLLALGQVLNRQKKPIGDINNISPYTILHNSIYVLYKRLSSFNIIERVSFIG